MRRLLALLPLALIASLLPASALAAEPGVHSDNMSYVKNIPYPAKNGGTANHGTDIEFARSRTTSPSTRPATARTPPRSPRA